MTAVGINILHGVDDDEEMNLWRYTKFMICLEAWNGCISST